MGPQGWFADPFGKHEARYFSAGSPTRLVRDGEAESYDEPPAWAPAVDFRLLTAAPSPDAPPLETRSGSITVTISIMVNGSIMVMNGVVAAAAFVVAAVLVVSERPISGLRVALFAALPVLVIGMLWSMVVLRRRAGGFWSTRPPFGDATAWFFSPLPRRAIVCITGLFVAGWLCAATALPWLIGSPACPHAAGNHGSAACVSKVTDPVGETAQQRGPVGVILGLSVMNFGVAWSQVRRRGQPDTGLF